VRVLIGLGILAILLWRLGTGAFVDGLRMIDGPAVLAALGIGLVTTVFSAWRWCLVARRLGLRLSLRTAVADYYRALFFNAVLPGGVLGDVQRAVRHGQNAGDVGRGVRAVVLERTGGQVVLMVVAVAMLLAQPPSLTAAEVHDIAMIPAVAVAAAALCVLAVTLAVGIRRRRSASRWRRAFATALADVRVGLLSRDTWPGVMILSATVLAGHLALFLVAARTAGSTGPVVQLMPLMVLALLAMGLPVNVGGWGPRESVSALAFGAAGLGATQGLTVAVVYGVLTLVASLPGAVVVVLRYTTWLRSDRPQVEREGRALVESEAAHRSA
jgi:uncharacterized membrane protein YbhN (UPF0104 family)